MSNYEPGQRAYKGFHEAYRGYNEANWKEESSEVKELWVRAEAAVLAVNAQENKEKVEEYSEKEKATGKELYLFYFKPSDEWDNLTEPTQELWFQFGRKITNYVNKDYMQMAATLDKALKDNRMYGESFDRLKAVIPTAFLKNDGNQLVSDAAVAYINKLVEFMEGITSAAEQFRVGIEGKCETVTLKEAELYCCFCGHHKSKHAKDTKHPFCMVSGCPCHEFMSYK